MDSSIDRTTAPEFSLGAWTEVGPRVWTAVAEPEGVTIGLVAGESAALVIDTGSSPAQGAAIRAAAEEVAGVPVSQVVVTHAHYDHLFGLAGFDPPFSGAAPVTSVAHESVAELMGDAEQNFATEIDRVGVDGSTLVAPTDSIVALRGLDVGGRRVELLHPGPAHTAGDLVVVVPDADLVFVGDLVEQAGPPSFGADSWPQEWPVALDGVIGLLGPQSVVVPGHGTPVNREYVIRTRAEVAAVAYEIERLIGAGTRLDQAEQEGNWPYPYHHVRAGVEADWARAAERGIRGTRPTLPLA